MRTVWKYDIRVTDQVHIEMVPAGASVLHVAAQGKVVNRVSLWVMVPDTAAPKEPWAFHVYGTGHAMPDAGLAHLGTALAADGALVWHLFRAPAR